MESSTTDTAATSEDALAAFFSSQRLSWYRDLHERYPLWCGDWPVAEAGKPAAESWFSGARLLEEAERLLPHPPEDEIISIDFDGRPSADYAPCPSVNLQNTATYERRSEPVEKAHVAALLAAISYACMRWRTALVGPWGQTELIPLPAQDLQTVLKSWAEHLADRIQRLDRLFLFGMLDDLAPTGHGLYMLRRQAIKYRDDTGLKKRWDELGRLVGIIPALDRGSSSTLPVELLADLVAETQRLMGEVKAYELNDGELDRVLRLVTGQQEPLGPGEQILREAQRKESQGELESGFAERRRSRMLEDRHRALKTRFWALRLAFPMLREPELDFIVQHRRVPPGGLATANAAYELLGRQLSNSKRRGRLPERPSTIGDKIKRSAVHDH